MIQDKLKDSVLESIERTFKVSLKSDAIEISRPGNKEHGDFATNIAFRLAKEVGKNPREIAEDLAKTLAIDSAFTKVEAVNGFVNFFLAKENYYQTLKQILSEKENFANSDIFKGKKVQVEFISANPTGPLTLGNGRGGFGGDALARVFAKAGAEVVREYYVNDGGNQVRILGDSILVAAGLLEKEDDYYRGEYIEKWTAENKEIIEKYKESSFELGEVAAKDIITQYIKPTVEKMNVNFDNWFSEKELIERGEVEEVIGKLKEYKLTKEADGALWMKTTEFGDDKDRVLVKADGEKTYFANDVAYHFDKLYKRKFDKVVNFWGADHHGYVGRIQAAVSSMGCPGFLDIVIMQLVRLIKDGQEFKMSKRKGTYVTIDDLLELIGNSSDDAQDLRDASDVARFFFLMRSFNTHMDFDLDLAKEKSDKNPVFYVKYAYARLSGILRNAEEKIPGCTPGMTENVDFSKLTEEAEFELIDQLAQLPNVINSILMFEGYPVHFLTFYAIDTAKKFHAFYDKCRVIEEDDLETTAARLKLVEATQIVLKIVMEDLIGIDAPERM